MLVQLKGQFLDRFVHHADVVDRMRLHGLHNRGEIAGSAEDVIVLEDEDEFLRDFSHDISDIVGESASFTPLLNDNPLIGVVFLLQAQFKLLIFLIRSL